MVNKMPNDVNNLSEREQEILRLLATGASNKEIAYFLHISANTVKVHLRNIYSKIGVTSRTEAAMHAVRDGYVSGVAASVEVGEIDKATAQPRANILEGNYQRTKLLFGLSAFLLLIVIGIIVGTGISRRNSLREQQIETTNSSVTQSWKILTPMNVGRSNMAVAEIGDALYVVGGLTENGVTGSVESFNIGTNTWDFETEKPTPTSDIKAVVIGGKIYVPGGLIASGAVTDVLEIFDPTLKTWTTGASVPAAVSAYASAAFEGKMYLFGGWDGQFFSNKSYVYDPLSDHWQEIDPMPTARGYLGAAVAGRKIFLIGGYDGEKILSINEVYQPDLAISTHYSWSQGPPLPEPISSMGTVSIADMIYILGGKGIDKQQFSTLVLQEQSDEWQVFEEPLTELSEGVGALSQGMNLYVIGGKINGQYQGIVQVYQAVYTISLPIISRSEK